MNEDMCGCLAKLFLSRLNGSQCEDGRNPAGILLIDITCRGRILNRVARLLVARSSMSKCNFTYEVCTTNSICQSNLWMVERLISALSSVRFNHSLAGKSLIYLKAEMGWGEEYSGSRPCDCYKVNRLHLQRNSSDVITYEFDVDTDQKEAILSVLIIINQ